MQDFDIYKLLKYIIHGFIIFVLLQFIPNYKIKSVDSFLIASIIMLAYYIIDNITSICKSFLKREIIKNKINQPNQSNQCDNNSCSREKFTEVISRPRMRSKYPRKFLNIRTETESEVSKSEIPKSEIPKSEVSKSEIPKSEIPKSEVSVSNSEVPKSEVSRSEVSRSEVSISNVSNSEVPKSEVSKSEVSRSEVSNSEVPKSEVSKSEVSKSEVSNSEVSS